MTKDNKKVYTVYKVINNINNKFYIGVHKTSNINDDYMGSGVAIKNAIKKYGIENFSKEILFIYDKKEDAYSKEKELLQDIWEGITTYNMTAGGVGAWEHINLYDRISPMKNPEIVKKLVANKKANGSYHTPKFKEHQRNITKKAIEANTGSKKTAETKHKISVKSKENWDNNKSYMLEKIRSGRDQYTLLSPDGVVHKIKPGEIYQWCKKHGYNISTLTVKPVGYYFRRKGKLKGWTILARERRNFESASSN